jgi:hypothetical protein
MRSIAILLGLVIGVLSGSTARACKCESSPVAARMGAAQYLFVGRVVSKTPIERPNSEFGERAYSFEFAVEESRRGPAVARRRVVTATTTASCGIHYEVGRSYIVAANDGPAGIETDRCTGVLPEEVETQDGGTSPPPNRTPTSERRSPDRVWLYVGGVVLLMAGFAAIAMRRRR